MPQSPQLAKCLRPTRLRGIEKTVRILEMSQAVIGNSASLRETDFKKPFQENKFQKIQERISF